MTDLTPLFRQCVNIVQSEIVQWADVDMPKAKVSVSTINDSFTKEATDFFGVLVQLSQFIEDVKGPYLSVNNESSQQTVLSIEDKNKIDEEFNYKVQQMYEKLKLLQTYETKRQSLIDKPKTSWFNNLIGDDEPTDKQLFEQTINTHRTQILRHLNQTLNGISKNFDAIQKRRRDRERQVNLLNFQNFEDDEDLNYYENKTALDLTESLSNDVAIQELSQQQVQVLEKENQEFLNMKTNQLKQVEKLHTSMLDILNLQTELSFQLETQADQINGLLDNHDQVQMDVQLGNRQLNKATVRNKKSANMIVTLCLVLGFLILFVDYISF